MRYLKKIESEIKSLGFNIISKDLKRPWGGFLVIDENQLKGFIEIFFKGLVVESLKKEGKLSPKILIVKPNSKLSWQYHKRRSEIWRVYKGTIGVSQSMNNKENLMTVLKENDQIILKKGERHRLIGLDDFGVVAEIWQHTDFTNPSDENDIIRISDDYGR
tara:strand:+ start:30270 stop:30752 length:483 start_codon:yes stop_codon:yes gene_type:complete